MGNARLLPRVTYVVPRSIIVYGCRGTGGMVVGVGGQWAVPVGRVAQIGLLLISFLKVFDGMGHSRGRTFYFKGVIQTIRSVGVGGNFAALVRGSFGDLRVTITIARDGHTITNGGGNVSTYYNLTSFYDTVVNVTICPETIFGVCTSSLDGIIGRQSRVLAHTKGHGGVKLNGILGSNGVLVFVGDLVGFYTFQDRAICNGTNFRVGVVYLVTGNGYRRVTISCKEARVTGKDKRYTTVLFFGRVVSFVLIQVKFYPKVTGVIVLGGSFATNFRDAYSFRDVLVTIARTGDTIIRGRGYTYQEVRRCTNFGLFTGQFNN